MKKVVRKIGISIIMVLTLWIALFSIDFVRLRESRIITEKPVIIWSSQRSENRQCYDGLGYSIEYYINSDNQSVYGLEIKLFGNIIWAWVE